MRTLLTCWVRAGLAASLAVVAFVFQVPASALATSTADVAANYAENSSHDAVQKADSAVPPLAQAWSRTFWGTVSYAVIADRRLFATVTANGDAGSYLLALDPATGRTLWGPIDLGSQRVIQGPPGTAEADLAYAGGRVFVATPSGLIEAFAAATGALMWTTLGQSTDYAGAMVTPSGGLLLTNGTLTHGDGGQSNGNTVARALSQSTGQIVWQQASSASGATVGGGRVYYAAAAGFVQAFDPATGTPLWTDSSGGFAVSFDVAVFADGRLWVREWTGSQILDAATGRQVGTFTSDVSPVVDGQVVFYRTGSTLQATDEATGNLLWQFSGDGTLEGSPLVVGSTVYIGSHAGTLYALAEGTGQVQATESLGAPVDDPSVVRRTMTAGEGLLVVPAGNELVAFHNTSSTLPPPLSPVRPPSFVGVPSSQPDQATSFLQNASHNGDDPASALRAPLHLAWAHDFSSPVSYPVIADGGVFVTDQDTATGTYNLYGFSAATGRQLWPPMPVVSPGGFPAWAAYDNGRVFEVSPLRHVMAVDAATGRVIWSRDYPPTINGLAYGGFGVPITAGGILYFSGIIDTSSGTDGAIVAVSERTGALLWLTDVATAGSFPTFTGSALVTSGICDQVGLDPGTGHQLWQRNVGCEGGGYAQTVAYHAQSGTRVWALDSAVPNALLAPATGTFTGSYSTTSTPAFAGNFAYYVDGGAVRAETIAGNWVEWSFSPPSPIQSAPVSAGPAVYVASADGTIYALDERTGHVLWHGSAGAPIISNYFYDGTVPGMAAGDSRLIVAATNRLAAFG